MALAMLMALTAHVDVGLAAADQVVEVKRNGSSFAVRAAATIAAPISLVWEVLTDYEHLPRFIPGLATSTVRLRNGEQLLLDQTGAARFLVFAFPIEVELEVREHPVERIDSHAVAGNLKRMQGRYELSSSGAGVRLRYTGELEPAFELPPIIGALALRFMVEEQFGAMVAEIERRAESHR